MRTVDVFVFHLHVPICLAEDRNPFPASKKAESQSSGSLYILFKKPTTLFCILSQLRNPFGQWKFQHQSLSKYHFFELTANKSSVDAYQYRLVQT